MKKYLLGGIGQFYKAQLHLHTNISDGLLTPQEVKEAYKAQGYSIVAFTDHEVIVPHNDLTDKDFLAITAYEQSVNERYDGSNFQFMKAYHFNFYAKDKNKTWSPCFSEKCLWLNHFRDYVSKEQWEVNYPIAYTIEQVNDMLEKAKEHGFLVTYNHPAWSQQSYLDYIHLKGLWGVETYNYDSAMNGLVDTETAFEDLLKAGNNIVPVSVDDMHNIGTAFGGFTMIEVESLDYDTVLNAMEKKQLYASMSPIIEELYIENDMLTVHCSKATHIILNTDRRWCRTKRGECLTEAVFDISEWRRWNKYLEDGKKAFIRLTIVDKFGKKAWTRAYFEDEL